MSSFSEVVVGEEFSGERVDVFLAHHFAQQSRSSLQKLIKEGNVTLGGDALRCHQRVFFGDRITVREATPRRLARAFAEEISLSILYEDEDLMIVDKPAGMLVHASAHQEKGTLVNALLHRFNAGEELSSGSAPYRPGIVHRLDKETSGCLLVAKNNQTHALLTQGFAERTIKKTYLALVVGKPRHRQGSINLPLGRHPSNRLKITKRLPPVGREAITDYQVLASSSKESLLLCFPRTGRMHQIRVHLQHLGHPIIGDRLYGKSFSGQEHLKGRHLLHAWKIAFLHPRTKKLVEGRAPLPQEFNLAQFDISSCSEDPLDLFHS